MQHLNGGKVNLLRSLNKTETVVIKTIMTIKKPELYSSLRKNCDELDAEWMSLKSPLFT